MRIQKHRITTHQFILIHNSSVYNNVIKSQHIIEKIDQKYVLDSIILFKIILQSFVSV